MHCTNAVIYTHFEILINIVMYNYICVLYRNVSISMFMQESKVDCITVEINVKTSLKMIKLCVG